MPDGCTFNGKQNILTDEQFASYQIGDVLEDDRQNPLIFHRSKPYETKLAEKLKRKRISSETQPGVFQILGVTRVAGCGSQRNSPVVLRKSLPLGDAPPPAWVHPVFLFLGELPFQPTQKESAEHESIGHLQSFKS